MGYQAIVTKYLGPTNTRPGRIKATASAGSITVEYEHALSQNANHAAAAKALADKFKWRGYWFEGGMPQGTGNVYVSSKSIMEEHAEVAFLTTGKGGPR